MQVRKLANTVVNTDKYVLNTFNDAKQQKEIRRTRIIPWLEFCPYWSLSRALLGNSDRAPSQKYRRESMKAGFCHRVSK